VRTGEHHAGHDLIGLRNEVLDVAPVFAESVGDVANVFTDSAWPDLTAPSDPRNETYGARISGTKERSGRFQTSRQKRVTCCL
jgi:hypothetical protein